MSLAQFFGILYARRWIIIAALVASILGALTVIAITPPRYQASTRVMLDIIKPDPVTGATLGNQFVRAYTKTQTELITDYKVAGRVVDQLGWTRDPAMLQRFQVPGDDLNATRRRMAQLIIDKTDARLIEGSNILEITYTAWSPDAAKTVVDSIRRAYIDASLSFKRESAGETADWYDVQTEKAKRLLQIAEKTKSDFERAHGLIMQDDKTDLDSARLAALSSQVASPSGGVSTSSVRSGSLELAQLDAQIDQARRSLGPNNPTLLALEQKRSAIAGAAKREAADAAAATAAANGAAGAASSAVSRALAAQKAKVLANQGNLATLRQLQDEVELRRAQYTKAADRAAELRLQSDVGDAGLTTLGNAVAPQSPSFPKIPLILGGSAGFGAVLGILAALLTELLSRRVRSWRDLEDAAGDIPVLAVISSRRASQPSKAVVWLHTLREVGNRKEANAT